MKIKHGIAIAAALAFLLLAGADTFAAAPGRVSYQGTLRKDGRLFSGTAAMEFRIINADGSVSYWASGSTEVFVSTGLFRYALGSPNELDFAGIAWKEITPYVQMKLGGAWLPPEPLYASVYSLHSNTAESSTGTFTVNNGDLRITAVSGSKGIIFPDGTAQYSAPGWAVTGSYTSFVGGVGVGTLTPEARLDVRAGASDLYSQLWRDSTGVIRATMTVAGMLYADGSQLRNLPAGADNLGSHTATKALQMAGFPITNAGAITANGQVTSYSSVTVTGALGLGAPRLRLAGGVELSSSAANGGVYISSNVSLSAGAKYYGDGSELTGVIGNDNLGNHTLTQNLVTGANWISYDGSPSFGLNLDASGNVGIGNTAGAARLDVRGAANNYIQIWRTSGSTIVASMTVTGILYADGAKLRNLPAGGTATRALDMASFNINNVSTVTAGYLSSPGAGVIFTTNALVMGGRLGIDTQVPQEKLHVNGRILASNLSGSGNRCVYADNSGVLRLSVDDCGLAGVSGDQLGLHVMTQNLNTNGNWISGDNSPAGLTVGNTGNVGVGMSGAATRLDVMAGSGGYAQFWRDSGGTIIASMTSTGLLYADASKMRNLPPGSDNLGNHTATTDLLMAGFPISNAGAITAASLAAPGLNLSPAVEISSEASAALGAGVRISSNVYIVGYSSAARYYGDGSQLTNIAVDGDNLGGHIATKNLDMASFAITSVSTVTVSSITSSGTGVVFSTNVLVMGGRLGVNTELPRDSLDVNGNIMSSSLSGLGDRCVTADNFGRLYLAGSACGTVAGSDNMGNQIMTTNLVTGSHWISFDGSNGGLSVNISSNVGIGMLSAATRLDVQPAIGDAYSQIWRNSAGVIQASMTAAGLLYADASNMRNLPSGADDLGSHTASQNLNLASHDIINVSTITAGYLTSAGPGVVFSTNLLLMDGNLGVNTQAPQEKLHVNGKILSSYLAGVSDRCVYVDDTGVFHAKGSDCGTAAGAADDLGSHIMTQNLETGANWLSYDGTNTGIRIDPLGNVSIGDDIANARLDVRGAVGNYIQAWRNVGGVVQASMSVTGVLYADGSQLRNLPLGADNLGSHTAAAALKMMNYPIENAGDITANGQLTVYSSATVAGELGLGAARLSLSSNIEISSETAAALGAGVRVSSNVYIVGFSSAAVYYGDGSHLTGVTAAGGNVIDDLAATLGAGSNAGGAYINNLSSAALGRAVADASLDVQAAAGIGTYAQIWRNSSGVEVASMTAAGVLYADGSKLTGVTGSGGNIADTLAATLAAGADAGGAYINNLSSAAVGRAVANASLDVQAAAGIGTYAQIWRNSNGVEVASMTAAGVLYADGSKLTGVTSGGGNIADTLAATLAAGADAGGAYINNLSSAALGRATAHAPLDVQAAAGDSYTQIWRNSGGTEVASMTAAGVLYADGSKLSGMGVWTIADTLAATLAAGTDAGGLNISNAGAITAGLVGAARLSLSSNVEISSETSAELGAGVHISSNVYIVGFSSAAKYYGDGSALDGVHDNLGSHVLEQNLVVGNWWLSGDGSAKGISINSNGNVGVGIAAGAARLEVNDDNPDFSSSGIKFTSFACTASQKLTADASGNLVCATDQTSDGTGNYYENLAETLGAGTNAGALGMVNLGNTAIGLGTAVARLEVQAAGGDSYTQIWRNSGGTEVASMTASGLLYADGSKLRNLPAGNVIDTLSATLGAGNSAGGLSIINLGAITANAAITTYSSMTVAGLDAGSGYSLALSSGINMPDGTVNAGLMAAGGAGNNYFAGNVGIGTAAPGQKLSVSGGNIGLSGSQKIVFSDDDETNNLKLQLRGGFGLGINPGALFYAAGGRHSWRDANGASERMALTTAYDGGLTVNGTGISSFAGSLGIGTGAPQGRLDVQAAGSAQTDMAQIWLNSGGVVISSMSAAGVMMASRFVGDGSALAGVHDDLGNHIATKDLNLNTFSLLNAASVTSGLINVGTITASGGITSYSSVTVLGELGVGAALRFDGNVEISSATGLYGGIYISTNVNLVAGAKYYVNGVELSGGSGGGNTVDTLQDTLIAGANANGRYIIGLSSAAIGRTNAEVPLDVQAVGGNTRVQIWRNEGGTEVSSMTADGALHANSAVLNTAEISSELTVNSVYISSHLAVGNQSGIAPSVGIMAMGVIEEADIDNENPNIGVFGVSLVNPSEVKTGIQSVIGGFFRGGIGIPPPATPNAISFNTLTGLRAGAWANTSGTVQDAYGLYVQNEQTAGTVLNNYGIYVALPIVVGTHPNIFGLYIADHTGVGATLDYNIYSAGDTSINQFDGKVRVGKELRLPYKTKAELKTGTAPVAEGEIYYCSDCVPKKIAVSTGTSVGQFADAMGGTIN